jgi:hypothetical protein
MVLSVESAAFRFNLCVSIQFIVAAITIATARP